MVGGRRSGGPGLRAPGPEVSRSKTLPLDTPTVGCVRVGGRPRRRALARRRSPGPLCKCQWVAGALSLPCSASPSSLPLSAAHHPLLSPPVPILSLSLPPITRCYPRPSLSHREAQRGRIGVLPMAAMRTWSPVGHRHATGERAERRREAHIKPDPSGCRAKVATDEWLDPTQRTVKALLISQP